MSRKRASDRRLDALADLKERMALLDQQRKAAEAIGGTQEPTPEPEPSTPLSRVRQTRRTRGGQHAGLRRWGPRIG